MEINWKQTSDKEVARAYGMQDRIMKRFNEHNIKAMNKYDEEFLAKVGIFRKENGRYNPKDLEEFAKKYERKYSAITTDEDSNSITMRSGYEWKLRPEYKS